MFVMNEVFIIVVVKSDAIFPCIGEMTKHSNVETAEVWYGT